MLVKHDPHVPRLAPKLMNAYIATSPTVCAYCRATIPQNEYFIRASGFETNSDNVRSVRHGTRLSTGKVPKYCLQCFEVTPVKSVTDLGTNRLAWNEGEEEGTIEDLLRRVGELEQRKKLHRS